MKHLVILGAGTAGTVMAIGSRNDLPPGTDYPGIAPQVRRTGKNVPAAAAHP